MISKKDAVSAISDLLMIKLNGERLPTYNEVYHAIHDLPSVDAVEVVRCRECRWCNMGECEHKFGLLVSNDENYCSYGERSVDI